MRALWTKLVTHKCTVLGSNLAEISNVRMLFGFPNQLRLCVLEAQNNEKNTH